LLKRERWRRAEAAGGAALDQAFGKAVIVLVVCALGTNERRWRSGMFVTRFWI
jgi:hypothetical protein